MTTGKGLRGRCVRLCVLYTPYIGSYLGSPYDPTDDVGYAGDGYLDMVYGQDMEDHEINCITQYPQTLYSITSVRLYLTSIQCTLLH